MKILILIEANKVVFLVSDTDPGLAADFDIDKALSLGMKIIHEMVVGLKGTIEYSFDNKASFRIKFPR